MRKLLLCCTFILAACTPSQQGQRPDTSIQERVASSAATVNTSSSNSTISDAYFGMGWEGKYTFINLGTGVGMNVIPDGYVVVSQHNYPQFPGFLLLKKDGSLFALNLTSKALVPLPSDLQLSANEEAEVYPSVTADGQFFLMLNTYDPKEVGGMIPTPIASRSYFFDAERNMAEPAKLKPSDFIGCYEYDSLHQRFFEWRCGEGIGSSLPLWVKDIGDQSKHEAISLDEFGRAEDDLSVGVEYRNGLFFAVGDKIIVLDPHTDTPSKKTYVAIDTVKAVIDNLSPYSITLDADTKTIVVGQNDSIVLLRFDENKNLIASTTLPEMELYANFVFLYRGKAFYQARRSNAIKVIDLNTWTLEKEIPVKPDEEVTLIRG